MDSNPDQEVHPISTIEWEERSSLPHISRANCVCLKNKLFVGGGHVEVSDRHDSKGDYKLFWSSADFLKWQPMGTPCKYYGLTAHMSKLVLVGGMKEDDKATNLLWAMDDDLNLSPSTLPAMPTERYWSSAVSIADRGLVVAGGTGKNGLAVDSVELLVEEQWSKIKPLPKKCSHIKAIIHNENLYLFGGRTQGSNGYRCKIRQLYDGNLVWDIFELPPNALYAVSFQQNFVAIERSRRNVFVINTDGALKHQIVGEIPDIRLEVPPVSLPSGELVIIGYNKADTACCKMFVGSNYIREYLNILKEQPHIEMWFIKMILLGAPRLGKTTTRRRLTGEISNLSSSPTKEQPSTGAVESACSLFFRNISTTTVLVKSSESEWESKDAEVRMIYEFIKNQKQESSQSQKVSNQRISTQESATNILSSQGNTVSEVGAPGVDEADVAEDVPSSTSSIHSADFNLFKVFRSVADSSIKHSFTDTAFLKMEDTGGQPEFMDMLPALTIGPALYLFFCKLCDELKSCYTVSYCSSLGKSSTPKKSAYTVEELLLKTLATISCFQSYPGAAVIDDASCTSDVELMKSQKKSLACIIGTYRDKVSEKQLNDFDQELQHIIRSTDFFRNHLVTFQSEDRMIVPIDNMHGKREEISELQQFLLGKIKRHFKKLKIPVSWLMLSLCLRTEKRITSLNNVKKLAEKFGISSEGINVALWFLHHHAGVLMYFPTLEELKDSVICDTQIVYDSATQLIVNTFTHSAIDNVEALERFRNRGQFALEDIRKATSNIPGDYIPLEKLVKLLEHLNIIACLPPCGGCSEEYFMPCVLQSATHEELGRWWTTFWWWTTCPNSQFPVPLFIRYKCGYVPIGVFSAMIARLVSQEYHIIYDGIKKNCVQFLYGSDYDKVTLISQPNYYAIHISRKHEVQTPAHEMCNTLRELVVSTLQSVTATMNYSFNTENLQLAFECPSHPGRNHLCVVNSDLKFIRNFESYLSLLPTRAHPFLKEELDWDNDYVDKDLYEIAKHMINWEVDLADKLNLKRHEIYDITHDEKKEIMQRIGALKKWKDNEGHDATYEALLKIFIDAKRNDCAEVICEVLRKRVKDATMPAVQCKPSSSRLNMMLCLKNVDEPLPQKMKNKHLVWFGKKVHSSSSWRSTFIKLARNALKNFNKLWIVVLFVAALLAVMVKTLA